MRPDTTGRRPLLDGLPAWATVRETAATLSLEQAVAAAESILEEIKAGKLQKPYPEGVRHTLRSCAARFALEATP